jgi:sugar phosphate isomerase/epimerase
MEIGVSSFAFGWAVSHGLPPMDEMGLLDFARRHKLRVIQLGDNLPAHTMTAERRAALRAAARSAGVALELGARGLTEQHLQTYLALCRELGARSLRFVADQDGYEPSALDLVALLRNAIPEVVSAGVTLGLENHDRLPAVMLRGIIDAVASPQVGICLDTANSFGTGEGLEQVAAVLAPVTVNLHVKDVAIARLPHQMGFTIEGRPLGRGQLPIRRALDLVRAGGRCESVLLEAWVPPSADMGETIRRELAWAEESILTLKSWETSPPLQPADDGTATERRTPIRRKR